MVHLLLGKRNIVMPETIVRSILNRIPTKWHDEFERFIVNYESSNREFLDFVDNDPEGIAALNALLETEMDEIRDIISLND